MLETRSFLGGIIAGVIIGVAVTVASQLILDFLETPDLIIKSIHTRLLPWPEKDFGYIVTVYNEGKRTATICYLNLEGNLTVGTKKIQSDHFSLSPDEEKEVLLQGMVYSKPGTYLVKTSLDCLNYHPNKSLSRTIKVDFP